MQCPKCRSSNVSAQKKGFSTGKAIGGLVVAGGIGALAGLHGKDKIEMHCLSCGNVFSPLPDEFSTKATSAPMYRTPEEKARWKKFFYRAYEDGNLRTAEGYLQEEQPGLLRQHGLDGAYKWLKDSDREAAKFTNMMLGGITLVVLIILYFVFKD